MRPFIDTKRDRREKGISHFYRSKRRQQRAEESHRCIFLVNLKCYFPRNDRKNNQHHLSPRFAAEREETISRLVVFITFVGFGFVLARFYTFVKFDIEFRER